VSQRSGKGNLIPGLEGREVWWGTEPFGDVRAINRSSRRGIWRGVGNKKDQRVSEGLLCNGQRGFETQEKMEKT